MPSLAAISLSAEAISSAWSRLSSAHGPAIRASGRALPKRVAPTATVALGAGSTACIGRTMKAEVGPVNGRGRLFLASQQTRAGRADEPDPRAALGKLVLERLDRNLAEL